MGPNADFFSIGLTTEEIDRLIDEHSVANPIYLYTTGSDCRQTLLPI
jgi:hypothetical protein